MQWTRTSKMPNQNKRYIYSVSSHSCLVRKMERFFLANVLAHFSFIWLWSRWYGVAGLKESDVWWVAVKSELTVIFKFLLQSFKWRDHGIFTIRICCKWTKMRLHRSEKRDGLRYLELSFYQLVSLNRALSIQRYLKHYANLLSKKLLKNNAHKVSSRPVQTPIEHSTMGKYHCSDYSCASCCTGEINQAVYKEPLQVIIVCTLVRRENVRSSLETLDRGAQLYSRT